MRRSRSTRWAATGLVVLAVTGLGWRAWAGEGAAEHRWASVEQGTVTATQSLTGTIQPAGRAELQYGTDGTVGTVRVTAGDTVTKGQVLLTLDRTALRRTWRAARSELATAQAQLAAHLEGQQALITAATSGSGGGSSAGSGSGSASTRSGTAATPSSVTSSVTSAGTSAGTSATARGAAAATARSSAGSTAGSFTEAISVTAAPAEQGAGEHTATAAVFSASSSAVSAASTGSAGDDLEQALSTVSGQQQAVLDAQSAVSTARTEATGALAAQQQACGVAYSNNTALDAEVDAACDAALTAVQGAQDAVSTAQEALSAALDALASTLTSAVSTLEAAAQELADQETTPATPSPTTPSPTSPATPSPTSPATPGQPDQPSQPSQGGTNGGDGPSGSQTPGSQNPGSQTPGSQTQGSQDMPDQQGAPAESGASGGQGGASAGSGTTITAAQLAQDQADVDAAQVVVIEASQALAGATVKAPWGGTVASVSAAPGGSATAGSAAVVLVAPGTTTVEIDATSAQAKALEVGQSAQVTAVGAAAPVPATVASVSTDPGSGTTFPVVLRLEEATSTASGTPATVSVVTGTSPDALTVPTSAISQGSVQVRTADGVERRDVTVGLVGASRSEITAGLSEGEEVSLADLDAEVAGAGEITTTRGGGGGFPGGGSGGPPAGGPRR